MKKIILFISIMFTSCCILKTMTKPFGFTNIYQEGNSFFLPSLHSAIKIEILEQKINNDTIEIKYQAGSNKKIINKDEIIFSDEIKFLKSQNVHNRKNTFQLYEIHPDNGKYQLMFIRDM